MDEIKLFLKEYHNELLQSSTSDEIVHPKIVGNYKLDRNDVSNQIVDWVLHYLETRKCPYHLAVVLAKNTAQQIDAGISKQSGENESEDKLLNSIALYSETIKQLPIVSNTFMEDINETEVCSSLPYSASVFAIKNKRRKMEDRHVMHHDLNFLLDLKNVPAHSYYAVFDGHSGVDAASYASAHLHVNITKHPAFLTDTKTAIAEAYKITDENFLKKCSEENLKSGSTAVCALIREKTVYLSWLGDSQAVLVKEGKPVIVTDPHKPERMDERKRIEDVGGEVTTHTGVPRVNGILAVTRALGDPDHKRYISSEPEITIIELDGTEDFLILACDGLWDGMSPEDVTSALYYNLSGSALDEPLDAVAAKLVHQSKLQGSEDNITAAVVFLRDIKAIKDYATKLLSQTSPQLNFFELNGGEKDCISEEVLNTPCIKPTVLELSTASAKKLKNTANVLSSAGITDSSYVCPFSENAMEGMSFQKTSSDAIFIPHSKIPPHLAPEATALSELPTPPIDDVLASQQFEKLSSNDLYQDLSSLSSESEPSTSVLSHSTETPDPALINVQNSNSNITLENDILITEEVKHGSSDITPEEAVDIASCVVSETIETAVKQISSETSTLSTSHKLNPYAEPFVMKSFISDSDQLQTEETHTVSSDDSKSHCEIQNEIATKVEAIVSEKIGDPSNIDISVDKSIVHDSSHVSCDLTSSATNLEIKDKDIATNAINISSEISFNLSQPNFEDTESEHKTDQVATCYTPEDPNIKIDSREPALVEKENCVIDHLPNSTELICGESTAMDSLISGQVNSPTFLSDSYKEKPEDFNIENQIKDENSGYNAVYPSNNEGNLLDRPHKLLESNSNVEHFLDSSKNEDNHIHESSSLLNNEILDNTGEKSLIVDNMKSPSKNNTEVESSILSNQLEADALINTPASPTNISEVKNDKLPDQASNVAKILNDILASPKNAADIETSAVSDQVNGTSLILNSISANPQAITSTELATTAAAVLSVEECSTETLTVDLQTLPDGIPEAEGVTEDVDSDSEKDGGWSYMKGNNVGNGKHKSKDLATKVGKLPSKADATIKAKKDITKPLTDNKSKLKTTTSVDKSRKPLPEKKILDLKEKNKLRTTSSTLPKAVADKPVKLTSTVTKVKKEITMSSVSKITTATSAKNIGATVRNTSTLIKSASHSTETNQLSKPLGSPVTGTMRPKSALTTNGIKTSSRPLNTAAPILKGSSTNQSNKSNVASTVRSNTLNRHVAATVPNKTLTKTPFSTKPAPAESKTKPLSAPAESKTKSLSAPIRKTIPPALKKPDGKETKDIVNKQISARKNVLNKTDTLKNAPVATRNAVTLNNKTVPIKSRPVPPKSDLSKKDVPKPTASKFPVKTSTMSKISQNATSGKVKKTLPVEEKRNEKKIDSTVKNEQSITEVTPVCDEEKFILEVNDKEVIVKEQDDALVNSDSALDSKSNVVAENKPLEEMPITS